MPDAQAVPQDIEYRQRLKFNSAFQYTTKQHTRADVLNDNYFHNISKAWMKPGDEIHVMILHLDGSWSKGLFEVAQMTASDTVIKQLGKWRSGGGERSDAPTKKPLEKVA